MSAQLVSDLIAARALIDAPEKWCKGLYRLGEARCPDQALVDACRGAVFVDLDRFFAARKALKAALPEDWKSLWLFNDYEATTHADVMALFDRAIEKARVGAEVSA